MTEPINKLIRTGVVQELTMLRSSSMGVYVGHDNDSEVLIPKEGNNVTFVRNGKLNVFVYRDANNRQIGSTKEPKLQLDEFAQLKITAVDKFGAYAHWGFDPSLIVPHSEQKRALEEGRWYVIRLTLNPETDRLYGTTRIEDHLDNTTLTVKEKDEVALMVFGKSELGFSVIVNNTHQGLIHSNEVFRPISIGDRITGYVKTIREDNKLDITVQAIGYRQFNDKNTELLAKRLQQTGILQLTDKSSVEAIYREFGISKKAFKKALGALYKERKVRIEEDGVIWIGDR